MIRFKTGSTRSHLRTLRGVTTRRERKAMNRELAKMFMAAEVPMSGKPWRDAQAAYLLHGKAEASKVIARAARS